MSLGPPELRMEGQQAVLAGEWTLAAILPGLDGIRAALSRAALGGHAWDLRPVERLDSAGAVLLWQAWQGKWPAELTATPEIRHILERVAAVPAGRPSAPEGRASAVEILGRLVLHSLRHVAGVVTLFGQLLLDLVYLLRHPNEAPWKEFSASVYKSGAQALPVAGLVGFLIGVTLSYLSALQLKLFGADIFIVNILGISIIRELGPVLVAVLVAGRSGSAMTAQIGVMRVTEEIDALAAMGISRSLRIVLPKVAALTLVMPMLVVWTCAVALAGGMLAAGFQLGLSWGYFLEALPRVVPVANLVIGLSKGAVFGFLIALLACHFGLRVRPNTDSLSANTTISVVASITMVILVDAVFAVVTRNLGLPAL